MLLYTCYRLPQVSTFVFSRVCFFFLLHGGLDELNNYTKLVSRRVCVTPKSLLLNCLLHLISFILALGKWEPPNVVTERTGAGTRKEVDVTEKVTMGLGSSPRSRPEVKTVG